MESDPVAVALKFAGRPLPVPVLGRCSVLCASFGARAGPRPSRLVIRFPGERGGELDGRLVALEGGGLDEGERFDLGGLSIGRSSDADVRRIEDCFASGIHVRIYPRGGAYYVEDMGSTNGTYLNGDLLESDELHHLDRIRIGYGPSSASNWRAKG